MSLKPCTIEHIQGIYEVESESFSEADIYSLDLIRFLCSFCGSTSYVYEDGGAVAGYIITCIEGRSAHVISIAVKPSHRRRGVGSRLLCTALRILASGRVDRVYLEVRVSNEPALNLYRRAGFREIERLKNYYSDGEDGIRMEITDRNMAREFCKNYEK